MPPAPLASRAFWTVTMTGTLVIALIVAAVIRLTVLHLPCTVARLPLIGRLPFHPGAPCTLQLSPFGVRAWMVAIAVAVLLVVLLGVGVVSVARQRRATRRLMAAASASAVVVDDRIAAAAGRAGWAIDHVSVTDHAGVSAFCYGLIRPRVLVGTNFTGLLDDVELTAVLAHEAMHAVRRDPLRLLVMRTAAAMTFFLPVVMDLVGVARNASEVAADRHAATSVGRRPLLRALLSAVESPRTPARAVVGGFDAELARVHHLTDGTGPTFNVSVSRSVCTAVAIVVLSGLVLWAAPAVRMLPAIGPA